MRRGERSLKHLPRPLLAGFVLLFAAQLGSHHVNLKQIEVNYRPLAQPMSAENYRGIAMGSELLISYLIAIRLQLHDNQAGRHFRYELIDYGLLVKWFELVTEINPATEYPQMLASRIYSSTLDQQRLRKLIGFVETSFDRQPQLHWRRMTEATLIAKHKLNDLELALRLAEKVSAQPQTVQMPPWARDFQFLLLADLNEFESAIAIIQSLLHSDSIKDVDEIRFLRKKLSEFQQKLFEFQQNSQN